MCPIGICTPRRLNAHLLLGSASKYHPPPFTADEGRGVAARSRAQRYPTLPLSNLEGVPYTTNEAALRLDPQATMLNGAGIGSHPNRLGPGIGSHPNRLGHSVMATAVDRLQVRPAQMDGLHGRPAQDGR